MGDNIFIKKIISGAALAFTPVALFSSTVSAAGGLSAKRPVGISRSSGGRRRHLSTSKVSRLKDALKSSNIVKEDKVATVKPSGDGVDMDDALFDFLKSDESLKKLDELFSSMVNSSVALRESDFSNCRNEKVSLAITSSKDECDSLVEAYKVARKEGVCSSDFLSKAIYNGSEEDADKFLKESIFGLQLANLPVTYLTIRDVSSGKVVGQFALSGLATDPVSGALDAGTVNFSGWAVNNDYFQEALKLVFSRLDTNSSVKKVVFSLSPGFGESVYDALVLLGKEGVQGFPKFLVKETCFYKKLLRRKDGSGRVLRTGIYSSSGGADAKEVEDAKTEEFIPDDKLNDLLEFMKQEKNMFSVDGNSAYNFEKKTERYSKVVDETFNSESSRYELIDYVNSVFFELSFERDSGKSA